ncbi:hypothetical protein M758_1G165900 [Ceratodon purpureus]|nr:hypothetical protein M758_1G165900 [Ceratodon purpureus]
MADYVAYNRMMELGCEGVNGGGLIDALPDDVFVKCLVRVPLQWHANLQRVSRAVRELVVSKEYYEQRRVEGASGSFVCMLQPMPMSTEVLAEKCCSFMAACFDPVYGVTLLDVTSREWQRLPAIPGLPRGLPTFCKLVAVKGKLVAMGGWWQSTWEPSRSVFVYDFSSQRWSQGADMLSVRNFFACGAVGSKVVVAGGHDAEKKALRSVEAFDVETGCWEKLESMREERDECTGVVMDGRFYVVSGYGTESQGVFRKSAEVYDAGVNAWSLIENMWPLVARDADVANPSSMAAMAGRLYGVHGKDIIVYSPEKNAWSVVEKVPEDAEKGEMASFSIAATGSSLVITGLARKNDTATLRTLSLIPDCGARKAQWVTVPCNDQFLNMAQTSCSFEM